MCTRFRSRSLAGQLERRRRYVSWIIVRGIYPACIRPIGEHMTAVIADKPFRDRPYNKMRFETLYETLYETLCVQRTTRALSLDALIIISLKHRSGTALDVV